MDKTTRRATGGISLFGVVFHFFILKFFPELAKELFYAPIGDWLRLHMTDMPADALTYLPVALIFLVGVMAVTDRYVDTTVHLSWPFLRNGQTKQEESDDITKRAEVQPNTEPNPQALNTSDGFDVLLARREKLTKEIAAMKEPLSRAEEGLAQLEENYKEIINHYDRSMTDDECGNCFAVPIDVLMCAFSDIVTLGDGHFTYDDVPTWSSSPYIVDHIFHPSKNDDYLKAVGNYKDESRVLVDKVKQNRFEKRNELQKLNREITKETNRLTVGHGNG